MSAPVLITPLKNLCIKAVAKNFPSNPNFGGLPDNDVKAVTDELPLDLPLELVGDLISDEKYWQRRSTSRWKNCDITAHGRSWKQLYFERHLQEALERFNADQDDLDQLRRLLCYGRRFVQALRLRQLPSHLDPQVIFSCMVNSPATLSITYGLPGLGMEYDRSLFGMKLADCRCLARSLGHTEALVRLELSGNCLDDDRARMLASGLADNISITHLDLSHNKISDRGARALAKLMDANSSLAIVDLADNQLHSEGGRALSRAIRSSCSLMCLNLRLNRLGDEGCRAILEAVRGPAAAPLERLNLSSNGAGQGLGLALGTALKVNRQLQQLDVSCNAMGPGAAHDLKVALSVNPVLIGLDVRGCGLGPEVEAAVQEEMLQRHLKRERTKLLGPAVAAAAGGGTGAGSAAAGGAAG